MLSYTHTHTLLLADYHDRDDDYPLAPEMMWVDANMRNDYQTSLITKYYATVNPNSLDSRKLLCTLLPKKHYICFSENLYFYLNRGMRLTKVRST